MIRVGGGVKVVVLCLFSLFLITKRQDVYLTSKNVQSCPLPSGRVFVSRSGLLVGQGKFEARSFPYKRVKRHRFLPFCHWVDTRGRQSPFLECSDLRVDLVLRTRDGEVDLPL